MYIVTEDINERRAKNGIDPTDLDTPGESLKQRAIEWIREGHYQQTRHAIDPVELDRRLSMVRTHGSNLGLVVPFPVQTTDKPANDDDWTAWLNTERQFLNINEAVRTLDGPNCPLAEMDRRRKLYAARKVS